MNLIAAHSYGHDSGPSPDRRHSLFSEVQRAIGDRASGRLIADFGGRRLYIPIAPAPEHVVTGSIGLTAARNLARLFGGDRLVIPVSSGAGGRRRQILSMRAQGASVASIARNLRCTERHVYKVLAAARYTSTPGPAGSG
ncbi:MAG TPA: Mor transcription activator family protein [Candidatus Binataceae bacterium]|nr:Mor transcription activator family protein [Candidatus Binataceae bacterium]